MCICLVVVACLFCRKSYRCGIVNENGEQGQMNIRGTAEYTMCMSTIAGKQGHVITTHFRIFTHSTDCHRATKAGTDKQTGGRLSAAARSATANKITPMGNNLHPMSNGTANNSSKGLGHHVVRESEAAQSRATSDSSVDSLQAGVCTFCDHLPT